MEFASFYNSRWTYQCLVPWTLMIEIIFVSPVFRNCRMPNSISWAFSIISLIGTNQHNRRNIEFSIANHFGKRLLCLYPSFDWQEKRSMKISHVLQILITANPIWRPIHVKILKMLACITQNVPDIGLSFYDTNKMYGYPGVRGNG